MRDMKPETQILNGLKCPVSSLHVFKNLFMIITKVIIKLG